MYHSRRIYGAGGFMKKTIKSLDNLKDSRILYDKEPPIFGYLLIWILGAFLCAALVWSIHTPKMYTIQAQGVVTNEDANYVMCTYTGEIDVCNMEEGALVEQGDQRAALIWKAMIYQVVKNIGAMSTTLKGEVDGIILTGGLCRFDDVIEMIRDDCDWIAPVSVYPGECEHEAMAAGALRVLRGEEKLKKYPGRPVWTGFGWDK